MKSRQANECFKKGDRVSTPDGKGTVVITHENFVRVTLDKTLGEKTWDMVHFSFLPVPEYISCDPYYPGIRDFHTCSLCGAVVFRGAMVADGMKVHTIWHEDLFMEKKSW